MGGFRPTPEGFLHFFVDWFNENVADHDVGRIVLGDAYVVWFCFVLGRAKCLVSLNEGHVCDPDSTAFSK